jgi:hypothetical protein
MKKQDIERLQAAGFTPEQIDAFVGESMTADMGLDVPARSDLPEVDLKSPSQVSQRAAASGGAISSESPDFFSLETAIEGGAALGGIPGGAAIAAGGLYGAYRLGKSAAAGTPGKLAEAFKNRFVSPPPGSPSNPIGSNLRAGPAATPPAAPPAGGTNIPINRAPAPMAPAAPAAAAAAPPAAQVQQMALQRLQSAGPGMARLGLGAGMAMAPSSTGPAVPSTGRMRGSEINPATGRGWTREEIAQYERNPQAFDSAYLPPPQMPR